ncbi:MAG: cation:proton antiporter [Fimbriimonadaceae bacterium]|nr:cation:proton antiporter [Chitinophagales bacterium]
MLLGIDTSIPFHEPVIVFAIVLLITLFSPIILNKIKVPGIIGMIIAGIIVGPHGFNLLERDGAIHLFGTVGLLYIMFLAGLEIDMLNIKTSGKKTLTFGLLTFAVPFILGFILGKYILHYDILSTVLLSILFSTQTLVAYPIVSRLGITKSQPVTITIGGTIITDTIVLLVLAIITNIVRGENTLQYWLEFAAGFIAFIFFVLFVGPYVARWVFRNIAGEGGSQFIFVLTVVFLSAFLSQLAGVEPIIGAFLAGLSLNRLIPHKSPLMNRIDFVGNNIFIPFFLISVGMIVNLKVLFTGTYALYVCGLLVFTALFSKYIAAYITQKIFGFSKVERNLIYGLSNAHAAAMLAIALVGFQLKLIDENILNGTIIVILISSLVSSFIVSIAGKNYVIEKSARQLLEKPIDERVMVTISNPETIPALIDFSILIKEQQSLEPIFALAVIEDDKQAAKKIPENKKMLEDAIKHASATETKVEIVSRVDMSISFGILRSMKELGITELVMGWTDKYSAADKIFGSVLDNILPSSEQMIYVVKLIRPINTFRRICVLIPPYAEYEIGFIEWLHNIKLLAKQTGTSCIFWGEKNTLQRIEEANILNKNIQLQYEYSEFTDWGNFESINENLSVSDLFFIIKARKGSVSYMSEFENIPRKLSKHFGDHSFVLIFPHQSGLDITDINFQKNILSGSVIQGSIETVNKIGKSVFKRNK